MDTSDFPYHVLVKLDDDQQNKADQWCRENIGKCFKDWTFTDSNLWGDVDAYHFLRQEDATLFTLTWC